MYPLIESCNTAIIFYWNMLRFKGNTCDWNFIENNPDLWTINHRHISATFIFLFFFSIFSFDFDRDSQFFFPTNYQPFRSFALGESNRRASFFSQSFRFCPPSIAIDSAAISFRRRRTMTIGRAHSQPISNPPSTLAQRPLFLIVNHKSVTLHSE